MCPPITAPWKCGSRDLLIGHRPLIMGILNATPDSFSDGGRFLDLDAAVSRGLQMVAEGADIIDVGGESTRPGAAAVDAAKECDRIVPVVRAIRAQSDVTISVDTTKSQVANEAIAAGASIINDVSAFLHDPEMVNVAKESGVGVVLMHMRGTPRTMQDDPEYGDVVQEVADHLAARVDDLVDRGIDKRAIAIDPGIGFGKTVDHNLALLAHLDVFRKDKLPVLVGLSRKSFLGKLTDRMVNERLAGSLAALVFCVLNGADIMRVHDVGESCDAIRVIAAIEQLRK